VVTAPDKPAGRGLKLQETAVKKYALEHGLYLMQPEKLKNPAFWKN
jgi:methionyl-tRNA formyltransferase